VITGKTPPKIIENAFADKGVPFITPSDIDESLFVTSTKRLLTDEGRSAIKKTQIQAGSICVTCIGSQMGKTIVSPLDAFTNQQINSVVPCEASFRNFLLLNLRNRREEIFLIGSSGSTMPIINKSSFEKLNVITSNEELIDNFNSSVAPLIDQILEKSIENKYLSELRNSLLPKLLSGELEVSEIEDRF
jgi:type I restriction enzyme S subunit